MTNEWPCLCTLALCYALLDYCLTGIFFVQIRHGSDFGFSASWSVNCSHQRNFWQVQWGPGAWLPLSTLVHRAADCWLPLLACAAAGCPLWNKDKGILQYHSILYLIFALLKLLAWSKNNSAKLQHKKQLFWNLLPGFYLFRTMSLSLLLHLSNIALLLIRHPMPSTSWATPGNKFSHMYLMVTVPSVWNCTLSVHCIHVCIVSCTALVLSLQLPQLSGFWYPQVLA